MVVAAAVAMSIQDQVREALAAQVVLALVPVAAQAQEAMLNHRSLIIAWVVLVVVVVAVPVAAQALMRDRGRPQQAGARVALVGKVASLLNGEHDEMGKI